ncbi:NAD(P)-dependent oxidoreductase [Aquabacter spiritensis]|uniref:D-3-phosphoglycerate dehydrogenase n=1 Tax=Aquabacter spiritensis TaxID=933073 RepID=A0A4R3M3E1_9HYPH|nr:NAD(P)-dependent oxidoreductase [Aquabacter spiritensis]TCT07700.1 D-3-phosphoglycerate dehydrogenase [Aquabacter spiritensis]
MASEPIVYATNALHPDGAALLAPHARLVVGPDTADDTLRAHVREADAVIVRAKLPDDAFAGAKRLKGVVRHGVGLDFIPVAAATAAGIPVANLPGSNTQAVAEYVFSALFHLRRPLGRMDAALRADGWGAARSHADSTRELGGTTLGLVGLGAIGGRIAAIASGGLGMRVLGHSRSGRAVPGVEGVDLPRLFAESDAIVIACPLTAETRGLVGADLIGRMPPHAVLINPARGAIVDTAALIAALGAGRIAGAATDVYDTHPVPPADALFGLGTLLMTPHVAGITATSMRAMSLGAAEEVLRILRGERPKNLVNPDCFALSA